MTAEFETIACPACGCDSSRKQLEVRDRFRTLPDMLFSIVRCERCRLLYLNPRPTVQSLRLFYAVEGYDPFLSSTARASLFASTYRLIRRFTIRRKASRVVRGLPAGCRVLDVGCATGEFLAELKRRGFDVQGVEPDPRAAEYARTRFGLPVTTGGIEDVKAKEGEYGLITFWHVLEHVPDLLGTLARAKDLLAPGGRIAIAVPNPQSFDAGAYGERWVAWDTPRHLYHFEPEVLLQILRASGLQASREGAVALDAVYHCLLSESGSALGLFRGGMRGIRSFVQGALGGAGSSELYFASK